MPISAVRMKPIGCGPGIKARGNEPYHQTENDPTNDCHHEIAPVRCCVFVWAYMGECRPTADRPLHKHLTI